jgi:FkbM family methyltransferase
MNIIDIGACVGEFIDRYVDDDNVIYAFEPLRINYDFLIKKYKHNDKIKLYNCAVSNFSGTAKFYIKGGFEHLKNSGSTLKEDKNGLVNDAHRIVEVIKISDFIRMNNISKVDILKIDVEGSEYDIFEDIFESGLLYDAIENVFFEDHSRKVASILPKMYTIVKKINALDVEQRNKIFVQAKHSSFEYDVPFDKWVYRHLAEVYQNAI